MLTIAFRSVHAVRVERNGEGHVRRDLAKQRYRLPAVLRRTPGSTLSQPIKTRMRLGNQHQKHEDGRIRLGQCGRPLEVDDFEGACDSLHR